MNSSLQTHVKGHVLIKDARTGEVLLDKFNAVHNKNMATAIARGLSSNANAGIFRIKLGNGGSSVSGISGIIFQSPNIVSPSATLYNTTWTEIVDSSSTLVGTGNSVTYQSTGSTDNSVVIICTATIAADEPADQLLTDSSSTSTNNPYAFDELGLFTQDNLLLTHLVFSPILKTANREFVVVYTLTVSVS
jgi:hypothetical protein